MPNFIQVRNLELRSAAAPDESKVRQRPARLSEEPLAAREETDNSSSRGTKIRSWKTMPPRVMKEKRSAASAAVRDTDEEGVQPPASLSPDLLRRTYPAAKAVESDAIPKLQGSFGTLNKDLALTNTSLQNEQATSKTYQAKWPAGRGLSKSSWNLVFEKKAQGIV